MKAIPTRLDGLLLLEPRVFGDERGFFLESWNRSTFQDLGIDADFVQDNHSRSARGVLRGLHFQNPNPQGKLVRVASGAVWDVAVDLRRSSPAFGQWEGFELSAANKRMAWIPAGFGHGFLTIEDGTDFLYKCDALYDAGSEHTIRWDDPELAIDWPLGDMEPSLSAKDRDGTAFGDAQVFA